VTDEVDVTDEPVSVATTAPTETATEIEPTETPVELTETPTEAEPTATETETPTEAATETEIEPDTTVTVTSEDVISPEETADITEPADENGRDVSGEFVALSESLGDFDIPEDGITIQETRLGEAVTVRVCTSIGLEANAVLSDVMLILAQQIEQLDEAPEALAVNLGACEPGATSRLILVAIEDALDFANGEIDEQAFQRLWQPG
jgi:hypothetical protein